MKRLLLILMLLVGSLVIYGQKIEDLTRATSATKTDLLIIDQSDATKGIAVQHLFAGDSLFLPDLATPDVKVLSPTSTGGTTVLETADGSEITWDTLTANVFMLNDITGLSSASVELSPAQIQALETTPIRLVAAQGTHKIIEFVSAVFIWDYVDTDFTVTNADNKFVIQYDASTDVSEVIDMNTFLEGTADAIRWCLPAATTDTDLLAQENKKLELFNEGTGDVTGGDNSTLTVKITYKVHDTGL